MLEKEIHEILRDASTAATYYSNIQSSAASGNELIHIVREYNKRCHRLGLTGNMTDHTADFRPTSAALAALGVVTTMETFGAINIETFGGDNMVTI